MNTLITFQNLATYLSLPGVGIGLEKNILWKVVRLNDVSLWKSKMKRKNTKKNAEMILWWIWANKKHIWPALFVIPVKREQHFTDSRNPQNLRHSANSLVIDYHTWSVLFRNQPLAKCHPCHHCSRPQSFLWFFPLEFLRRFLVAFWWFFWDCKEARKLTSTPNIVDSCILYHTISSLYYQRKHEALSHEINVETQ